MKNCYKTMIYPFDLESLPLIRHNKFIDEYNIVNIISPNGWAHCGKDAGDADNGQSVGITVDNDFDKALENCDTAFFVDSSMKIDLNKFVYPKIIKAAQSSKNIICTIKLEDEMINKVSNTCNQNNRFFKYFKDKNDSTLSPKIEKIYPINTPVILVAGLCERTNKFEIQLSLRENLEDIGYKVSQIGTRHYCELMGFHSFPKFMYSKSITESEKIILFNHHIKNIESKEAPDVIVIGIPGGTMPITHEFTNKFGILAYEVSQAVMADVVVVSTLCSNSPESLKLLSQSCKYKFGYDIDCYNISNTYLNIGASKYEESLQFDVIDLEVINEKKVMYKELDVPVYNILDINDAKSMTSFLLNKLSGYGNNQII